jgi:hypothetical protein
MNVHNIDLEVVMESAESCLALKPDGFDGDPNGYDKAIIGLTDNGQLVYSKEWMVKLLVECAEDMDEEEAWEFLEYNTFNAYVGEQTPIYVNTYETFYINNLPTKKSWWQFWK